MEDCWFDFVPSEILQKIFDLLDHSENRFSFGGVCKRIYVNYLRYNQYYMSQIENSKSLHIAASRGDPIIKKANIELLNIDQEILMLSCTSGNVELSKWLFDRYEEAFYRNKERDLEDLKICFTRSLEKLLARISRDGLVDDRTFDSIFFHVLNKLDKLWQKHDILSTVAGPIFVRRSKSSSITTITWLCVLDEILKGKMHASVGLEYFAIGDYGNGKIYLEKDGIRYSFGSLMRNAILCPVDDMKIYEANLKAAIEITERELSLFAYLSIESQEYFLSLAKQRGDFSLSIIKEWFATTKLIDSKSS